jgi:glycosyltransferase involved in cell wall biosynthesis
VKARIAIIAGTVYAMTKHRFELINSLLSLGLEVVLIIPSSDSSNTSDLLNAGVEIRKIALKPSGRNIWQDIRSYFELKKVLKNEKPNMVLCFTIKPVIYGSLAAKKVGVSKIYSIIPGVGSVFIGDSFWVRALCFGVKILYKKSLRNNRLVFFENPDDLKLFADLKLANKEQGLVVDGCGVNIKKFEKKDLPKKISFTLLGRIIKDKGVIEYIEAVKLIKKKHPDVSFYLAGPASDNPTAIKMEQIRAWVDSGLICYLSELDDVRPLLETTSVFVLPSYREGTPRASLEAMAMGRPIITTDVPGCRETVIDGENGFLIPPKNVEVLVEKILYFISKPERVKVMGDSSRRIVVDRYDVERVNEKIINCMLHDCGL